MSYKAIIIDDESKLRDVLEIKLAKLCPEIEVIAKLADAKIGYHFIIEHMPDIVFLDIKMPGESGFQMLERFNKIEFEIIFVTGFDEYGLDALKVSAVDYILKPIKNEDLILAVSKAKERIQNSKELNIYALLKENLKLEDRQKTKIIIPLNSSYEFLRIDEIIRLEGWQGYTRIVTMHGDILVSSNNIGVFKDMLKKYKFFQTHKSHLINSIYIQKYSKEGFITMVNGDNVPLSRRKKEEFIQHFLRN